jgi:hypothetical protein
MAKTILPEVWLRGAVPGIPLLLQPVIHALLQAREEVQEMTAGFPNERLWQQHAGVASVGFHLQHLTGVLDRLFTYARGESLTADQLGALASEGKCIQEPCTINLLVQRFHQQIDLAMDQLSKTDEASLTDERKVGRGQLPSTVIGLYFHAAEHTMRHVGQLLVTIKTSLHV